MTDEEAPGAEVIPESSSVCSRGGDTSAQCVLVCAGAGGAVLHLEQDTWRCEWRSASGLHVVKRTEKKIISFVSMLALNYTNLVEKRGKKRSGDAAALPASITASLYPWMLWPELQLWTQNQSQNHISCWRRDRGTSALWQNYCSFHFSIFIIVQFLYPVTPTSAVTTATSLRKLWFMTPLALGLIRATTRSSLELFTGIVFVSFSGAGREEKGTTAAAFTHHNVTERRRSSAKWPQLIC